MKIGFVVSMYDESEIVLDSIKKIRSYFFNKAIIVVVHSDNKENSNALGQINQYSNSYTKLENLFHTHDEYTLPSAVVPLLVTMYSTIHHPSIPLDSALLG